MDGKSIPDLAQAPAALLPAMHEYVEQYDSGTKATVSAAIPQQKSSRASMGDRFASIRISEWRTTFLSDTIWLTESNPFPPPSSNACTRVYSFLFSSLLFGFFCLCSFI